MDSRALMGGVKRIDTEKVPVSLCATFRALGATLQFVPAVRAYPFVFPKYVNGMNCANVATHALSDTPAVIRCPVEGFFAQWMRTGHTSQPH